MHMSPLSSLAHSGFFSTVMEKSIGQMLANPRPAATTPATARAPAPVSRAAVPASPTRAERRKQARGLIRVSSALPARRPTVSRRKKRAGP